MISVIIPTYNEENYIGTLLECLKNQTWKDFEIIVADANSKDKTNEIVKKYSSRIVKGGHQAFGRNNGARYAKGEILVFMDADLRFNNTFLDDCCQSFESQKLDIACCYFDTSQMSLKMKLVYKLWNNGKYLKRKSRTPVGEGQCLWIKKSVFKSAGGFNETMNMSEDVDLIHRVVNKKYSFGMLDYRFIPSTRRYEQVGVIRVMLGSFMSGVLQLAGVIRKNKLSEYIYGGWGKYEKKK
ncbi:hypothetical protein A2V80_02400 [Candidatus Woesebacteria bacterium RBG_16_39_8b]|uniref:Glycosyltransferase 2-like domain-containing protein n=1 Tax=Candidatus Woesebacteria bacterium RBG_16_39_8b TaxID=1802482 RepID=A0A1F7X8J6_9BACT|nr:MAG: hypothetical protein A2V80_02400 [Candidatus Woesebacteria bacterium RBG_16_39_8b]